MSSSRGEDGGGEWEEAQDGEGNTYYYNAASGETSWERPAAVSAWQHAGAKVMAAHRMAAQWQEAFDEDGNLYYFHPETQETSWEPPPGNADEDAGAAGDAEGEPEGVPEEGWSEAVDGDGQRYFVHDDTGETAWERPTTAATTMTVATAATDATDWEEARDDSGNTYFYNATTGESSWEQPAAVMAWQHAGRAVMVQRKVKAQWQEHHDEEGNLYYYNPATQETSWEAPFDDEHDTEGDAMRTAGPWQEFDDGEGHKYYFNTETQESSWEMPPAFAAAFAEHAPEAGGVKRSDWHLEVDEDGNEMYVNVVTGERQFVRPKEYWTTESEYEESEGEVDESETDSSGSDGAPPEGDDWWEQESNDENLDELELRRAKTLKDLEEAALREAQEIVKQEEARKRAEIRAQRRAERERLRAIKREKRRKVKEEKELRQKFIDQEAARKSAAAKVQGKLQRPCHDCEQREATCYCVECNEYLPVDYCNACWELNHNTEEMKKHTRRWIHPRVHKLEEMRLELVRQLQQRNRERRNRRERQAADAAAAKFWELSWTADGHEFYRHTATDESSWEVPEVLARHKNAKPVSDDEDESTAQVPWEDSAIRIRFVILPTAPAPAPQPTPIPGSRRSTLTATASATARSAMLASARAATAAGAGAGAGAGATPLPADTGDASRRSAQSAAPTSHRSSSSQPGTGRPNGSGSQPGTGRSHGSQSGTGRPHGSQPGTGRPHGSQPGTSRSHGSQPGTGRSRGSQPGTGRSPGSQPGTGRSHGSQPGTGRSHGSASLRTPPPPPGPMLPKTRLERQELAQARARGQTVAVVFNIFDPVMGEEEEEEEDALEASAAGEAPTTPGRTGVSVASGSAAQSSPESQATGSTAATGVDGGSGSVASPSVASTASGDGSSPGSAASPAPDGSKPKRKRRVMTAKEKRARRRARMNRKRARARRRLEESMRKQREEQEKKTEVWIEKTDGVGNLFWVNEATKETLLEHPVAKAKREMMHHAEMARMKSADWVPPTAAEAPRVRRGAKEVAMKEEERGREFARKAQKLRNPFKKRVRIKDMLNRDRLLNKFKKFQGHGVAKKHVAPHPFDVAVQREREQHDRNVNGVFLGGRLIKVIKEKRELWRPLPHNHVAVYVDGDEYCVVCRRYKWEHVQAYWKQKEDLAKTRARQRNSKQRSEEKRRKEEFAKLERIWQSGKETFRRNTMAEEKRAKHIAKWKRKVNREYKRRAKFWRHLEREEKEEATRNDMWMIEQEQREAAEADRRVKETNQLKLQEHLRQVYLQLMSDCKGLERMKRVSWQRGVAVGTHSTFHIVRDATAGERFVLKTMFVPSEVILRRLQSQVTALQRIHCPYLLPIKDQFAHPLYPGLGTIHTGHQLFMLLEHMRGWTLRFKLAQRLQPTPHQVYMWLKMMAIALTKLHTHNIVHDNVSSEAIFFKKPNDARHIVLGGYVLTPTPSRGTVLMKKNVNLIRQFIAASHGGGGLTGIALTAAAGAAVAIEDTAQSKVKKMEAVGVTGDAVLSWGNATPKANKAKDDAVAESMAAPKHKLLHQSSNMNLFLAEGMQTVHDEQDAAARATAEAAAKAEAAQAEAVEDGVEEAGDGGEEEAGAAGVGGEEGARAAAVDGEEEAGAAAVGGEGAAAVGGVPESADGGGGDTGGEEEKGVEGQPVDDAGASQGPASSRRSSTASHDTAASIEAEKSRKAKAAEMAEKNRSLAGEHAVKAIRRARRNSNYTGMGTDVVAASTDVDEFLSTLTGTNMTYLAPERLNFSPAAKTSDIWAFGCLAFEICTGKRPWLQLKKMDDIIRAVPRRHHPLIVPLLKHTLQQNPKHRASARQILKYFQSCRWKTTRKRGDTRLLNKLPRKPPPIPPKYTPSAGAAIARARARAYPGAPKVVDMASLDKSKFKAVVPGPPPSYARTHITDKALIFAAVTHLPPPPPGPVPPHAKPDARLTPSERHQRLLAKAAAKGRHANQRPGARRVPMSPPPHIVRGSGFRAVTARSPRLRSSASAPGIASSKPKRSGRGRGRGAHPPLPSGPPPPRGKPGRTRSHQRAPPPHAAAQSFYQARAQPQQRGPPRRSASGIVAQTAKERARRKRRAAKGKGGKPKPPPPSTLPQPSNGFPPLSQPLRSPGGSVLPQQHTGDKVPHALPRLPAGPPPN